MIVCTMEEKIKEYWNTYKKQIILILVILFVLFKTNSIVSDRINLTPEKVYEINTLPNVCENVKAGGFSDLFYKDGKLYILTDRGPNNDVKFIGEKEEEETNPRLYKVYNYSKKIVDKYMSSK